MNQKNFDFLKDQVKYTGFGEALEKELKENIEGQKPEFTLQHKATYGKDEMDTTLYFKKSGITDMYFFNKFEISLKDAKLDDPLRHTFYINRDNTFTQKEAYNLLKGRAVNKDFINKEGKEYNVWVEMDLNPADNGNFKQKKYSEGFGFDLEKALLKHPIKELSDIRDKGRLIEGLRKGNLQPVTFNAADGKEQKGFVKANPQFKNVSIYDQNMQRFRQGQREDNSQSEANSQQQSERKEQKTSKDDSDQPARKARKKKGMAVT